VVATFKIYWALPLLGTILGHLVEYLTTAQNSLFKKIF